MYEGAVQDLIDELGRLPGVGPKSAQRHRIPHAGRPTPRTYAGSPTCSTQVKETGGVLRDLLQRRGRDPVPVCRDPRRIATIICVVQDPRTSSRWNGPVSSAAAITYSAAPSARSPASARRLKIRALFPRLADGAVTEVILATDPNLEGEATATYLAE